MPTSSVGGIKWDRPGGLWGRLATCGRLLIGLALDQAMGRLPIARRFTTCPTRRVLPRAGITLVEMVVVVAIIGLIAGISFPSISAGLDSVRMVSATDSVAAFLNRAVNRAQRRQQPVMLAISPKENLLTLDSTEPGFRREFKVPDG